MSKRQTAKVHGFDSLAAHTQRLTRGNTPKCGSWPSSAGWNAGGPSMFSTAPELYKCREHDPSCSSTALLHHLIRRLDLRAPRPASSDAAQVSAAGSTGSYTCRPTAARWRMPVHEVAKSMLPVDAQVLLGCGSDTSGAGASRCHPGTRLDDSMCRPARAEWMGLTGGDMGSASCDVGGTGAHPRADEPYGVLGSWRMSTCSVPAPEGHGDAAENG
jgi:hypothetical protein